jgi:hypothetical protein
MRYNCPVPTRAPQAQAREGGAMVCRFWQRRLWRLVPMGYFWSFIRAPMKLCAMRQAACRSMPRGLYWAR